MIISLAWGRFTSATGALYTIMDLSVITAMERPFKAIL